MDTVMKCYRMLVTVCALLLVSAALSLPVENQDKDLDSMFEEYKKTHEKVYSSPEEEAMRRGLWEEALKRVEAHNKEADQGLHTYWIGINQFSDQTEEERKKGCLLPLPPLDLEEEMKKHMMNTTAELEPAAGNSTNEDGDSSVVPTEAAAN